MSQTRWTQVKRNLIRDNIALWIKAGANDGISLCDTCVEQFASECSLAYIRIYIFYIYIRFVSRRRGSNTIPYTKLTVIESSLRSNVYLLYYYMIIILLLPYEVIIL